MILDLLYDWFTVFHRVVGFLGFSLMCFIMVLSGLNYLRKWL